MTEFSGWALEDALESPEVVAAYLNLALEEGDPGEFTYALGVAARSRGMSEVARRTGLNREGLYTSLSREGNPTLSTLTSVLSACGVRMRFEAIDITREGQPFDVVAAVPAVSTAAIDATLKSVEA